MTLRYSICLKRRYETKAKVRGTRDIQQGRTNQKLFIYKCSKCGAYHLTRQSNGKDRQIT